MERGLKKLVKYASYLGAAALSAVVVLPFVKQADGEGGFSHNAPDNFFAAPAACAQDGDGQSLIDDMKTFCATYNHVDGDADDDDGGGI